MLKNLNPFPKKFSNNILSLPFIELSNALKETRFKKIDFDRYIPIDKKPIKSYSDLEKFLKKISKGL